MASYLPWTKPGTGVHPRYWMSDVNGPTVASIQARALGSHATQYGNMKSWCSSRYSYALSYWDGKDPEYTIAFAFAWLMEPSSYSSWGQKAIEIALYLAGLSLTTGDTGRNRMVTISMIYDLCYSHSYMTSTRKETLKKRVADYVYTMKNMSGVEYIWGTDGGDSAFCLLAMLGILGDGESSGDSKYLDTTWDTWMDDLMDTRDDGSGGKFHDPHRFYGNTEGGSYKGVGQSSYTRENEIYYSRLFPAMASAVDQDWWTDEPWYKKWMHWQLWHLRCDHTWHLQGDSMQLAHYDHFSQVHAMQVAALEGSTHFGKACQWLVEEIQANSDLGWSIWGPYYLWYVLWHDTSVSAVQPTIADYGGGSQMKTFPAVGKIVIRDGWGDTASSVTISIPKHFTGGHQHRDAGHFDLAALGVPLLTQHGHYPSGNQYHAYKERRTWTRSGSTVTITWASHGLVNGTTVAVRDTSDATALPAQTYEISNVTTNTFTVTGGSSGASSGQCSAWRWPTRSSDETGHRYSYYKRIITKNVCRIYDSDEPSENDLDSFHPISTGHSEHYGVYNPGTGNVDVNNLGGQLTPKNTAQDNSTPDDFTQLEGGGAEAKWRFDSWAVTPVETSTYCYAVANLALFYYSGKCTSYKRHWLWLKPGTVPNWARAVLIVWDDMTTHIDASPTFGGKKTQIYQLQPTAEPTGDADDITVANGSVRLWHKMLNPSVEKTVVEKYYDPNGILFPASYRGANDDDGSDWEGDGVYRLELNPASQGTNQDFLAVLGWGLSNDPAFPSVALYSDDTYYGVQFGGSGGLIAAMDKSTPHAAIVTQDLPPAAPTGLEATPVSTSRIDLDWDDNIEEDFANYKVYKSKLVGGEYEAWGSPYATPSSSSQQVTGLDADSTYRFKVVAVDDAAQESDDSTIVSASTLPTPPESGTGAGLAPWRRGRRFSKYSLDIG